MLADSGYTLQERIGSGGMGIVYRATDAAGLDVALKVLRPEIAGDEHARARLSREMRALQRVNHPNVSRVLDAEFDLDVAFLVTEYIPGPTFQQVIDQWGYLSLEHVRNIALPLGRALLEVHDKGVVHRDLKPSNIMLRNVNGPNVDFDFDPIDPVIIDFGIAQAAEESRMTSTGLMMGTIAYLAPEVISHNTVDAAADWWAWAAMLAHAATGFPPFGKSRLHSVYSNAMWGGPSLEGLPEPCIAWFEGAFAPEPGDRTPPEQLIEALENPLVWGTGGYDPVGREATSSGSSPSRPSDASSSPHPSQIDVGKRVKPAELNAAGAAGLGGAAAVTGSSGLAQSGGSSAASSAFADVSTPTPPTDPEATAPLQPNSYLNPEGKGIGKGVGEGVKEWEGAGSPAPGSEGSPYDEGDTDEWDVADEEPTQVIPVHDETPTAKFAPISTPAAPPTGPAAPHHGGAMPSWQPSDPAPQNLGPSPQGPYHQAPYQAVQPGPYGAQGYGVPPQGFMPAPVPYHLREPERRTVLVLLGMVLFTAFGALVPLAALILLVLMTAFARTWQRSWIAKEKGQDRGKGAGSITTAAVLLAVPRYIGALLEALLQALIPVIVTAGVLLAIDAALVWLTHFQVHYAIYAGVLVGLTTLSLWWGIGARTTRFGGHRLVHAAAPSGLWTAVIAVLLIVLIAAVCFTIASRGGTIDYFPYVGEFRLEDISPWRR